MHRGTPSLGRSPRRGNDLAVIMITSSLLSSSSSSLRRYRYHTSSDSGDLDRGHGCWYLIVTQEGPYTEHDDETNFILLVYNVI